MEPPAPGTRKGKGMFILLISILTSRSYVRLPLCTCIRVFLRVLPVFVGSEYHPAHRCKYSSYRILLPRMQTRRRPPGYAPSSIFLLYSRCLCEHRRYTMPPLRIYDSVRDGVRIKNHRRYGTEINSTTMMEEFATEFPFSVNL